MYYTFFALRVAQCDLCLFCDCVWRKLLLTQQTTSVSVGGPMAPRTVIDRVTTTPRFKRKMRSIEKRTRACVFYANQLWKNDGYRDPASANSQWLCDGVLCGILPSLVLFSHAIPFSVVALMPHDVVGVWYEEIPNTQHTRSACDTHSSSRDTIVLLLFRVAPSRKDWVLRALRTVCFHKLEFK